MRSSSFIVILADRLAQPLGHVVDEGDDLFIGKPLRPDDADRAQDLALVSVMGEDERAIGDEGQVGLGADEDFDPVEGDEIGKELGQVGLFLEILEERA